MSSKNPFQKAVREGIKIRLLIWGKSGGGKTLTALQIAAHMGGKVAVVDTERGSAKRYAPTRSAPAYCQCAQCMGHGAHLDFDVMEITDHGPDNFRRAMKAAEANGYEILILDSISHEWEGVNGCLEQVDDAKARSKNKVSPWSVITQKHEAFLQAIRAWPGHVICTARAKQKVDAKANDRGVLPVQRNDEGIFYEFDLAAYAWNEGCVQFTKARDTGGSLTGQAFKGAGKDLAEKLLAWAGEADAGQLEQERKADQDKARELEQEPQLEVDFGDHDQRHGVDPNDLAAVIDSIRGKVYQLPKDRQPQALASLDKLMDGGTFAQLQGLEQRIDQAIASQDSSPDEGRAGASPGQPAPSSPPLERPAIAGARRG